MVNFLVKSNKIFKRLKVDLFFFSIRRKILNKSLYFFFLSRFVLKRNNRLRFRVKFWRRRKFNKLFKQHYVSLFKQKLLKRQLLRFFYNITFRMLKRLLEKFLISKNWFTGNVFLYFENRLDRILFKTNLFVTIRQIMQWISHRKIIVNNHYVTKRGFILKEGDFVFIKNGHQLKIVSFFQNSHQILINYKYCFFIVVECLKKKQPLNLPFKMSIKSLNTIFR